MAPHKAAKNERHEEFDQEGDRLFRRRNTNADTVLAGTEAGSLLPAVLGDLPAEGISHAPPAPR